MVSFFWFPKETKGWTLLTVTNYRVIDGALGKRIHKLVFQTYFPLSGVNQSPTSRAYGKKEQSTGTLKSKAQGKGQPPGECSTVAILKKRERLPPGIFRQAMQDPWLGMTEDKEAPEALLGPTWEQKELEIGSEAEEHCQFSLVRIS